MPLIVAISVVAGGSSPAMTADEKPFTGEIVPTFFSRAVTGPLRNKSVCYVCRNGDRPVVMLLFRKMPASIAPFLRRVDDIVDRNRAAGLRSFGTLISEDPSRAVSVVQTFAFDGKIRMPLTVAGPVVADADCHDLEDDAVLTVVMYHDRRVVARVSLSDSDIDDDKLNLIVDRIMTFAAQVRSTDPTPGR